MNTVQWLMEWYDSNCDENWEHDYGVSITTLDTMGWSIKLNTIGTLYEKVEFEDVKIEKTPVDWIQCKKEDGFINCKCSANNLEATLKIIRKWMEENEPALGQPIEKKVKFAILDAVINIGFEDFIEWEEFKKILYRMKLYKIKISNEEIISVIKELLESKYIEIYCNVHIINGDIDYTRNWYKITEKGVKLWKELNDELKYWV